LINIVFSAGPWAGQQVELDREITFGREGCDLTLDEPEVSRRHVELRPAGEEVHVEDLGSSNGTFVNGHKLTQTVSATAGDVIRVGTSEMTVEVAREAEPTRAAPSPAPARTRSPSVTGPALTERSGGLPGWFWAVAGVVEVGLILTATVLLVYYAVS
jgi:pSer/pThr/pTyr-binding forkhead associated (FHA) protein